MREESNRSDRCAEGARQKMEHLQRKKFSDLLRFVWENSVFYREYYRSHGIKESELSDVTVADLPFVTKRLLMEHFDDAVTDTCLRKNLLERWIQNNLDSRQPFHRDFIVVHSSGSAGETGVFAYDRLGWQVMTSTMAQRLPTPDGLPQKTRVAFYIADHGNFTGQTTALELPTTVFDVLILSDLDSVDRCINRLNQFQPQRLVGYASSIAKLAEWQVTQDLQISPKTVFVSGDALTSTMSHQIHLAWDAQVHVMYMSSESAYLAIKTLKQPLMIAMDDLNILEVLDDENCPALPNFQGRVVLTNLYNRALPILRYELRDYVIRGEPDPLSPFSTIREIVGRVDDALPIVSSDGRLSTLDAGALLEFHTEGLEKIQFVVVAPNRLRLDYIAPYSIDEKITKKFQQLLTAQDGLGTCFAPNRVDDIRNDSETGKLRLVRQETVELGQTSQSLVSRYSPSPTVKAEIHPTHTFTPFARNSLEQAISQLFEAVVQSNAERPAIKVGDRTITYRQLNDKANHIANVLLNESQPFVSPICLFLDKNECLIEAILGVLKSGNSYVVLDTLSSETQLQVIMNDVQPSVVLTTGKSLSHLQKLAFDQCRVFDLDALESNNDSGTNPQLTISPKAKACVIYTSGTTGVPKGVVHTHENVLHACMMHTNDFYIVPEDRLTFLHSSSFNPSLRDIFGALLNGACLFPFDIRTQGFDSIPSWLSHEKITILATVPTIYRQLVRHIYDQSFPTLRVIDLVGETLDQQDVEIYRTYFEPQCILVNSLASTECHVIRRFFLTHVTQLPNERIPCGYSVTDKDVVVLDENHEELGPNRAGKIAVKSCYLATGYWRRPDLSQQNFQDNPLKSGERMFLSGDIGVLRRDGMLYYIGRVDAQIKIRGLFVDISEVQRAMREILAISEVAVGADTDSAGNEILVAYYSVTQLPGPSVADIRKHLIPLLPDYMIPSQYILVEVIPKTSSGKVDVQAVRAYSRESKSLKTIVSPSTTTERNLEAIWREVLGADEISITDSFLEVGGHSIAAMQMISRIRNVLEFELSLHELFRRLTIEKIAEYIDAEKSQEEDMAFLNVDSINS